MKKLILALGLCLSLASASAFANCKDCDKKKAGHEQAGECAHCKEHANCDADCHEAGHKHSKKGKKGKKAKAAAAAAVAPAAPAEAHSH